MYNDLDFSCTLFNLYTVGCKLSFQRRAIACQELRIIQFRVVREMLCFMLLIAHCGR